MEITTEEVSDVIKNSRNSIVLRLPLFRGNEVAIDRAVGFIKSLEEHADIDVIVFSRNAMTHERVITTEKRKTKSEMCQWVIDGLHLDYLPYTEVIISIQENDENMETIKKLCLRYGILDANNIIVRS